MISLIILFLVGILAGFINTLAGGGSAIVIPVLILAGIDPLLANATNRVAILLQNATGSYKFHKHGILEVGSIIHITIAAVLGAIAGSIVAIKITSTFYNKILAVVFILLLVLMLKPHKKRSIYTNKLPKWFEFIIFLLIGFYGGLIQVGVGFIFLATLNLVEEYDIIKANAAKVFIILSYTIFTVIIFAYSGKVIWKYGLVLAAGNIIGALFGVKVAITKGEKIVKIILTIAIIIACLRLFGVF